MKLIQDNTVNSPSFVKWLEQNDLVIVLNPYSFDEISASLHNIHGEELKVRKGHGGTKKGAIEELARNILSCRKPIVSGCLSIGVPSGFLNWEKSLAFLTQNFEIKTVNL